MAILGPRSHSSPAESSGTSWPSSPTSRPSRLGTSVPTDPGLRTNSRPAAMVTIPPETIRSVNMYSSTYYAHPLVSVRPYPQPISTTTPRFANRSTHCSYMDCIVGAAPDPTFLSDERSYSSTRGLLARNVKSGGTRRAF